MKLNFDHLQRCSLTLERWLIYRDSRNDTAHNYGEQFADSTLTLITDFQRDALALYETLRRKHG
ncbi:MAG: hypothetical protein EXS37_21285 [Opitutus sp.]|nr:hypothetical protein [Opitutus sp.]